MLRGLWAWIRALRTTGIGGRESRVVMTLLVRDEIDIVAENIDFHLRQGVDFVIATDNGSEDGTRELLAEYQKAGVLHLIDEPGRDYAQGRWVTRMAHLAREEYDASWVLNNDADEFWRPRRGTVKDVLRRSRGRVLRVKRRNMLTAREELGQTPWWSCLVHRVVKPTPLPEIGDRLRDPLPTYFLYSKVHPKALVRADLVRRVVQGNHQVETRRRVRPVDCEDIDIYHYPVRSREQFLDKVRKGGASYANNSELSRRFGWHWRRWFHMLESSGAESVLREVLPGHDELRRHLADGILVRDVRMADELGRPASPA